MVRGRSSKEQARLKRKLLNPNQELIPLIVASAVGGAASTIGALSVERAFRKRREAKEAEEKAAAEAEKEKKTMASAGRAAARAAAKNPVAPFEAEFAVKRWGHLSYTGPEDLDITWPEFAARIEATGDPGSAETAAAVRDLPGLVREYAVFLDNPGQRKLKNRLLK